MAATPERKSYLRHWIVVYIDNLVQVLDNDFGNRCKFLEVIGLFWCNVHVDGDGSQVTHCNLS